MKTKIVLTSLLFISGLMVIANAASGLTLIYMMHQNSKTVTAWTAAESCLAMAEKNLSIKRDYKRARPEVISTEQMACIARARNIVK